MLALKLLLVPAFLLALGWAGERWGAHVAGWLAGLPVVAGPILCILALEQGADFAAAAACASLAAVLASLAFSGIYARVAQAWNWPVALVCGLSAWFVATALLATAAPALPAAAGLAVAGLLLAPRLFPTAPVPPVQLLASRDRWARAVAGAGLTVAVAAAAPAAGPHASGLLAVFPVLGVVLAVSTHRRHGPRSCAALLRGMAIGLWSFSAFCLCVSLSIARVGPGASFALATAIALSVQWLTTRLRLRAQAHPIGAGTGPRR